MPQNVVCKLNGSSSLSHIKDANAGGSSKAGTKLKATSGWSKEYGFIAGSDTYGFSALAGGSYYYSSFEEILKEGRWWTATQFGPTSANNRYMSYEYAEVGMSGSDMNNGFSVRCLQD